VIGSRHGEDVRHRAAVTATRLAESERTPGPRAVGVTPAEAPVLASHAFSARDLKRDEHPLAYATFADLVSDRYHLGHRLVSDRKRPGEEAERCHRPVKITTRDGDWTHKRTALIREPRIRNLFPGDPSGFEEGKLAQRRRA
jgi:hypothetical protein